MRYLQVGFAGEGPTDFDFLKPLAFRVLEHLLLERSTFQFELPAAVDVYPGGRPGNAPREVVDLVKSQFGHLDLLFLHADAWAAADVKGLCAVLGLDAEKISLPDTFSPGRVESIEDPKRSLRELLRNLPVRRFKPVGLEFSFLGSLALRASIEQLQHVPQFARFMQDLESVLEEKGLI